MSGGVWSLTLLRHIPIRQKPPQCPSTAQLTPSGSSNCVSTTGLQGDFGFWYDAGTNPHITWTVKSGYGSFGPYDITGPIGGGGGGGSPGGSLFQFQFNNTIFAGSPLFTYNTVTGAIAALPRVDVRSSVVQALGGCANPADPTGVLDSTCAINAAVTYAQQVFGSGSTSRAVPQVYLATGKYLISGPIITSNFYDIGGDGPAATQIIQSSPTSNVITVRSQSLFPFFPNPIGAGGGGRIHDLAIGCTSSGTPGAPFAACQGNALEFHGTDFQGSNVTITNWGGRGIMGGNQIEQTYLKQFWFPFVRLPISNIGQANTSIDDTSAGGAGQTTTYTWSAAAHNGYAYSSAWNPSTCSITAASVDGAGNASITVSCDDLTHGYTTGVSSPLPPGQWFTLSGIVASGLTDLNGTYQAVAVTGASGSAFTITFRTFNQSSQTQWTYDDNAEPLWFCGNNVACPVLTPSATSASSITGLFQIAEFPPVNGGINISTVVGSNHNIRTVFLNYANGWVDSSAGDTVDGIYQENGGNRPVLSRPYTAGGWIPYTSLTQATAASGTQTITVNNASWFPIVTGDVASPTTIAESQMNYSLFPIDYNPNQTGVASCCVSGVNTNQMEVFSGVLDVSNNLYILARHINGSTAPVNTVWPIGSLLSTTFFGSGKSGNSVNLQREVSSTPGGGNGGFDNPICSDQGCLNICADLLDMYIPNFRTFFPSFSGTAFQLQVQNPIQNGEKDNVITGYQCMKVGGNAEVTISGTSWASAITLNAFGQAPDGPGIAQGVARHSLSTCVVFPQLNINGTLEVPQAIVHDSTTHSTFQCASSTPGSCAIDSDISSTPASSTGFGGASSGQTNFTGNIFSISRDQTDENGFSQAGSITAWSIPSIAPASAQNLTLTTTLNPPPGSCVVISGLTVGAPFNSGNACWVVRTASSTTTTVFLPQENFPASMPLSATESGTITMYGPAMQLHWQGGTQFSGANTGWDFNYSGSPGHWTPALSIRQGTTAGTGNVNVLGTLSTSFPMSSGLLSNGIPQSAAYTAGTWSAGIGAITLTGGQTDPWGGTTATKFAVTTSASFSQYMDVYVPSPLIVSNTYHFCSWVKGNAGGETIYFSGPNASGNGVVLSTSWQYLCSEPLTISGSGLSTVFQITSKNVIQTFFLAGSSTTLVGNSDVYLATGATPSPTPTATLGLPWLSAGVAQVLSGGVITSSTALANGTTATTQSPADNSTKVATTAYVDGISKFTQLTGTTGTITGTALTATCDSGTATVTGAVVGHTVGVSTTDGTDVGGAFYLRASVTSTNTITVSVCGTGTPPSKAYTVTTY